MVSLGETAGFLMPVAAILVMGDRLDGWGPIVLLLAAGAAEGAVLGWSQALVLGRVLSEFSRRDWVVRTALAAVVAWSIGITPSALEPVWQQWPGAVQAMAALDAGVLLLLTIGVAQWTVLRRHLAGSARWIAWTAAGWLAGLGLFLIVATPLWHPGQHPVLVAGIGVLAGVSMAVAMAAVTGWGVVRLLSHQQGR
jgi:Ca2+-transporting ATPase